MSSSKFTEERRPKFHFKWEHIEDTRIFSMPIEDYEDARSSSGEMTEVEISKTPLSQVEEEAGHLISIAETISSDYERLSVLRSPDPGDTHEADRDEYEVWTNVLNHPSLDEMVNLASTNLDADLRDYLSPRAFLVKREPKEGHHLTAAELPERFPAIFEFPEEDEDT